MDCGEKDTTVLEFDHRGNKLKEVSLLITGRYPIQKIEQEVKNVM